MPAAAATRDAGRGCAGSDLDGEWDDVQRAAECQLAGGVERLADDVLFDLYQSAYGGNAAGQRISDPDVLFERGEWIQLLVWNAGRRGGIYRECLFARLLREQYGEHKHSECHLRLSRVLRNAGHRRGDLDHLYMDGAEDSYGTHGFSAGAQTSGNFYLDQAM